MSKFITTDVKIDDTAILKTVEAITHDDGVMTEVHQAFAEIINPYVPYDTGNLSQDITVSAEGVTYHADYAAKQYYGEEFHHNKEHHPLASAHWDAVAMQTEKEAFANRVTEIIKERENNG